MADTKDILLKIGVVTDTDKIEVVGKALDDMLGTYEDNVRLLSQYNQTLNETSAGIKALNKAQQEQGSLSAKQKARYEELIKLERETKQGKADLQIVMKNQEKLMQAENGSMKQQSLMLGQLRMLWRSLTDEQKAAMPQLKAMIDGLDKSLKSADADIGNFQRNVGNYPQLMGQISSAATSMAASISPALGSVTSGFVGISSAASPLGGVIAAVGIAIKGVTTIMSSYQTAVDNSAELTYKLRDAMVSVDAVSDAITRRLEDTSDVFITTKGAAAGLGAEMKKNFAIWTEEKLLPIATFIKALPEGFMKAAAAAAAVRAAAPLLGEETKKVYEDNESELIAIITKINAKQQQLDKLREGNVMKIKKLEYEASEELLKTRDKEKYSDEERLEAARKYEKLTKDKFALLRQEAELERDIAVLQGERTGNTHAVNMAIEQTRAKLYDLGVQENQALRRTAGVRGTITKTLEKEAKAVDPLEKALKELDDLVEAAENEVLPRLQQVEMPEDKRSPLAKWLGVTPEEFEKLKSQALSAAQSIYGSIQQLSQQATQQRLEDELEAVDKEAESEKAILKSKLDRKLINQKQYEKKLAEVDKAAEERREEANREAFKKNKAWNIGQALMNMALAITNIWATNKGGAAARIAETVIATTTGLAQVAAIAAQKYARGGELHGASHAQGGIKGNIQGHNIELEGGEIVINKRSSAKYRKALSLINSENGWGVDFANTRGGGYKFARGGVLNSFDFSPSATPTSSSVQQAISKQASRVEELIMATNRRIDRLQVQVNISDIESASDTKHAHVSRASL